MHKTMQQLDAVAASSGEAPSGREQDFVLTAKDVQAVRRKHSERELSSQRVIERGFYGFVAVPTDDCSEPSKTEGGFAGSVYSISRWSIKVFDVDTGCTHCPWLGWGRLTCT